MKTPCELCGQPTGGIDGVCQRTDECKRECTRRRRHAKKFGGRVRTTVACAVCGQPTISRLGVCRNGGPECFAEYMRRTIAARPGAEPTAPRLVGIGGRRGAPLPRSWRLETVPPLDVPEEWRPIAGYEERYEISDHGRIKGLYRYDDGVVHGHLIKCALNRNGYLTARLQDGRKRKTVPVHRLVAEAFIGPRPPGMVVRHGLGGRADASLANIGYGTPEQNRADITQHREILRSSGIGGLTDAGVLEIHRTWLNGAMPARVAEEYVAVMGHASKLLEREKRANARRTASTAGAPASPYPPVAEKMLAVTYQAPETRMTA